MTGFSESASATLPTVILAGGLGTRLGPDTRHIPKALVEVAGQPFLSHQLRLLRRNGVGRVLLLIGHLGEQIQQSYGNGDRFGLSLEYSFDGPSLLGTAGAIRQALPMLPEQFLLLYGDSYLPCDFRAVAAAFLRSRQPALMTVYRNDGLFDRSNIEFDGSRIVRYDKRQQTPAMHHIDYGLCVFDRRVFAALPDGVNLDLAVVCQTLIAAGQLAAFEVGERFYEIGSPHGLRDTETYLRAQAAVRADE